MNKNTNTFNPRWALVAVASAWVLFLSACNVASNPPSAWSEPEFAGIPDARKFNELSGLAHSTLHKNIFWAINDSGNAAELLAIDNTASTRAVYKVETVNNIDWEDITSYSLQGKHYLAVADTGDNGGIRESLYIHIFEEPAILEPNGSIKPVHTIRFVWADGPRDVEALMADAGVGKFYLVSKKRVPAELYALPFNAKDGASPHLVAYFDHIRQPDALTRQRKNDFGRYRAQITGADIDPNGREIALLNYQEINFFQRPRAGEINHLSPTHTIVLPWLPQAEAISYSQDGRSIFIGSEQAPTPLIRMDRKP